MKARVRIDNPLPPPDARAIMAAHPYKKSELTPSQWLRLNPLVPAAVVLMAGLALGSYGDMPLIFWFYAACLCLAAYALCELTLNRMAGCMPQILIVAGICCFGGAWYTLCNHYVESNNIVHWLTEEPTPIQLRARINSTPRLLESDDVGVPLPPLQFCVADVEGVETVNGWTSASGQVTLRVPAEVTIALADRVEVTGFARRPPGPKYPGAFDYRDYLASSHIFASVWTKNSIQVRQLTSADGVAIQNDSRYWSNFLERFRQAARARIQAHIAPENSQAGDALQALVLGYRSPAMRPVTQAFTDAGIVHLLAISGSHIVLVAGVVWLLLHPLVRRPRWRVLLMVGIVWCYVAATPGGPPILRAAIALTFFALATLVSRPMQPLNILAGALIVCLLIDPADIGDAGLQLSFAATAGLLVLAPRLHNIFITQWAERQAAIVRAIGTRRANWWFHTKYSVALILLANLIGSLIAAPLVAYHFYQLNPLAVFSGVLALPIVSISLIVGLVHLLFSAMGSGLIAGPAVWCAEMMNRLVFWLAQIPGSSVVIRPPPMWLVMILFAAVIVVAIRRPLKLSRASALLILLASCMGTAAWYPLTARRQFHLWTLGSTAVVQNQGRILVVNPGSPVFVRNQLDPFLRYQGISRVDAMILPRAAMAQAGGSVYLARRFNVNLAIISQQAYLARHYQWTRNMLLQRLDGQGCKVFPMAAGDHLVFDQIELRAFWPPMRDSLYFTDAQSPLMMKLSVSSGSLAIIPDEFPAAWPMSPEMEPLLTASAVILTSGQKEPLPGILTLCGDDRYGAYEMRDGKLNLIAETK